jgi:uncharacterized protein (DUF488 family)
VNDPTSNVGLFCSLQAARTLAPVWTIGHSTRSLDALVALLRAHGIARVADVRRFPRSRRHPHVNTETLARDLPAAAIAYRHLPGLGGFRRARPDSRNTAWRNASFRGYADYMETGEFAGHLDTLLDEARLGPTAIMCAEAVPWRCHRSLISDALLARGVEVRHILSEEPAQPHALTAGARVEDGRVLYPGEPDLFSARG